MKKKRYYVQYGDEKIFFTQREKDVSELLICRKTYKEIAKELNISPRTVEFYLENVKLKCRVYKKLELIEILKKLLKELREAE